jgi:hypothetical protein
MQKRRFSLFLPVVQVAIAAYLTHWSDGNSWLWTGHGRHPTPSPLMLSLYPRIILAWQVCLGINAPAMIFKALALLHPSRYQPPYFSLFGFTEEEVWFLIGIGVLWYLIGRVIDRRQSSPRRLNPARTSETVANLLLGFGIFLLIAGSMALRDAVHPGAVWLYPFYDGVFWILLFLWSVCLIVFPAIAITRGKG